MFSRSHLDESRILIVDDAPANVEVLRKILQHWGFAQVRTLLDAREALAVCSEFAPHVIFLDARMPHMSGLEVLRALSTGAGGRERARVIMLSGDLEEETMEQALKLGAVAYVTKPFLIMDLMETLERVLGIGGD